MLQYIAKRLVGLVPTLLLVGILVFLLVHLLPGDPARLAAGPDATPETVQLVRKDLGLDLPLPQQFVRFVGGALTGDFGRSIRTKRRWRPKSASALRRRSGSPSGQWPVRHGRHGDRHPVRRVAQPLARPARHDARRLGHFFPAFALGWC